MRHFFDSRAGKFVGVVLFAIMSGVAFAMYRASGTDVAAYANRRMFMDASTMKPFPHDLKAGERLPIDAPSGTKSGYPAELCYWTADGKIAGEPTYVLLNEYLGKSGPTFCPVCGRLVIGHNPVPVPESTPPITEEAWRQAHAERPGPLVSPAR